MTQKLITIQNATGAGPYELTVDDSSGVALNDHVADNLGRLYRVIAVPLTTRIDVADDVTPRAPYGMPTLGTGAAFTPTSYANLSQLPYNAQLHWDEVTRRDLERLDDQFPRPADAAPAAVADATPAVGTSGDFAREDHVHAHGPRGGGSLHAAATPASAGFLSASDKSALDALVEVKDEGIALGTGFRKLNFKGVGVTTSVNPGDPTQVEVDITSGGGGSPTVKRDGTSLGTKSALNFVGAGFFSVANDVDPNQVNIEVSPDVPVAVGATNSEGTSGHIARSDHVHAHGSQAGGTTHAIATTSTDGFLSSTDKTKLDGVASGATNTPLTSSAPADVTKAAAVVGIATDAARADHKHDVSTGTPSAVGSANAEGVATSLARSDHVHSHGSQLGGSLHADATTSTAGFLSATDKTKLDGVASGATNTPLTSAAPADVTKAAAVVGISTDAARADHKHDVSTGTPSTLGGANAEGSASSLARSDHVHAHGSQAGGSLHAAATTSVAGFMSSSDKSKLDLLPDATAVGEPTGFPNTTTSTISFVNGTRTFTVAPTGASFDFFRWGLKYTVSSPASVVISDVEGLWYLYFAAGGVLTASQTLWDLSQVVPIATVYWSPALGAGRLQDERHGITMDWATHAYLHLTQGMRYVSGLDVSGFTLDTDSDVAVTLGITSGYVADEDLTINIRHAATPTQPFEQILNDPAQIPVWYRDGATGGWKWDVATTFPFKNTTAGRVNYNQLLAGTWQQTEATNGYFVAYWICATNNVTEPIIAIQGQREDSTLVDAIRNNPYSSLSFGGIPVAEIRPICRLIVQTATAFAGTRKAKLQDVAVVRTMVFAPQAGGALLPHTSLLGLPDRNDHPQYQLQLQSVFAEVTADATTTSTTWVTLFSQAITIGQGLRAPNNHLLCIDFSASCTVDTNARTGVFRLLLDGVPLRGAGCYIKDAGIDRPGAVAIVQRALVQPGARTVTVQWRIAGGGGTLQVRPVTNPDFEHASLLLTEIKS